MQTQITEREAAMPLGEKIKEIFKKYGVTVTAIFLAADATIGAVIGAMTNALKALGKKWVMALKRLEQKPLLSCLVALGLSSALFSKLRGVSSAFLHNIHGS